MDISQSRPHIGVDYGSKVAGTTVIAYWDGAHLQLKQSAKKQDADAWLRTELVALDAQDVWIDAPLSLPGVYRGMEGYEDYFYRKSDKEVAAMSPMFLGGLTARAMRLAAQLVPEGIIFRETYPGWQARRLALKTWDYKGKVASIPEVLIQLQSHFPFPLPPTLPNWHQVDALLALLGSLRHADGTGSIIGDQTEGAIWV